MKMTRRLLNMAVAVCLCCTMIAPAMAAKGDLPQLPYAGKREQIKLTAQQAAAYAQQIRITQERAKKEWNENGYSDTYSVRATLVGTGENTLLWIANYGVTPGREVEWPGELEEGGSCVTVDFEEIWEWDGVKTVAFTPLQASGAHAVLRSDGMEAFSVYLGTDVDGDAWDAFYRHSP